MNLYNNDGTLVGHSYSSDIQCYPTWYRSFSNQEQSIRERQHSQQQQQQQQQPHDKQKEQCRGNRKLQRHRRKLRKQGMNSHTLIELIRSCINTRQSKTDEVIQQNEQANKLADNETILYPTK